MSYLGIYRALFDHEPQADAGTKGEAELAIKTGDLLYIVEKGDDANWWKARKKAADEEEEEPEGLVPKNYIDEAQPIGRARALFEYTRQTAEELSFPDGAVLDVFDASESDWTLVGLNGDFGFAPSNYIDLIRPGSPDRPQSYEYTAQSLSVPARSLSPSLNSAAEEASALTHGVTAGNGSVTTAVSAHGMPDTIGSNLSASVIAPENRLGATSTEDSSCPSSPAQLPPESSYPGSSDRFRSEQPSLAAPSPVRGAELQEGARDKHTERERYDVRKIDGLGTNNSTGGRPYMDRHRTSAIQASPATDDLRVHGGFHLYNINEMVSVLGKKKKVPSTLGINIATRMILIAPERSADGPPQEWSAEKMTHHSREGKHVFLELTRPSRSIDFHAGAKDTAEEIVSALGELAAIIRAVGLPEAIMPPDFNQMKGVTLYDFVSQGNGEVTVGAGDEVLVLDDRSNREWWIVRRVKTGEEGVVPSSYVKITEDPLNPSSPSTLPKPAGPTVEQNRFDEKRLASDAVKTDRPGNNQKPPRTKPDPSRLRSWTDRSKSFSVEAQYLGVKDGKLNLHKANGVKIAVALAKISVEDLEYLERVTGFTLTSGEMAARIGLPPNRRRQQALQPKQHVPQTKVGASIEQPSSPEYDWFQFFLSCEVAVGLCERYAQAFIRDSMDESVLPDVDGTVLRTLGLREGDIIKVMRMLDTRFGRSGKRNISDPASDTSAITADGVSSGLFSGAGGALRNNTKKGRPPPATPTSAVVDPNTFLVVSADSEAPAPTSSDPNAPPAQGPKSPISSPRSRFDDDAWDLKSSKQQTPQPTALFQAESRQPHPGKQSPATTATTSSLPAPTGEENATCTLSTSMEDLSLLATPLQPSKPNKAVQSFTPPATTSPGIITSSGPEASGTGSNSALFARMSSSVPVPDSLQSQQTTTSFAASRQRPLVPQSTGATNPLVPPPPQRPLSAPQTAHSSAFALPPLAPQMTAFQAPVTPVGQSLCELAHARQQQQFPPPMAVLNVPNSASSLPMATPFSQVPILGLPHSQLPSPIQPPPSGGILGFTGAFVQPQPFQQQLLQPMVTGSINSYLPPALEPQRTGIHGHVSGVESFGPSSLPQLQPQTTGPPPDVRFGVTPAAGKVTPQPTGRRANLAQATPNNPFGF